jgi:hypothetical protein
VLLHQRKKKGKWRIRPWTLLGIGASGQTATPGDFDGDGKTEDVS